MQIADGLHPIANPAVDSHGNIYATFSGSRGQKTPVSVFQVDAATGQNAPFVSELMNASALAIDHDDVLYVSSRQEGNVYRVSSAGNSAIYVEGMGVATGIVFDPDGNLYVGDRSGTIFKVNAGSARFTCSPRSNRRYRPTIWRSGRTRNISTLPDPPPPASIACIASRPPARWTCFYRGLGRPQGMAFDAEDNLYVASSFRGRRGVARITFRIEMPNCFSPARAL